jgi:hypothetical protein
MYLPNNIAGRCRSTACHSQWRNKANVPPLHMYPRHRAERCSWGSISSGQWTPVGDQGPKRHSGKTRKRRPR